MLVNILVVVFLVVGAISSFLVISVRGVNLARIDKQIKLNRKHIYTKGRFGNYNRSGKSIGKLILSPDSRIYNFYEKKLLVYSRIGVYQFMSIKLACVLLCLLLIILIRQTNIAVISERVQNNLYYKIDVIYENAKGYSAEVELDCFNKIINSVQRDKAISELTEIFKLSKERASHKIKLILQKYNNGLFDLDAIANGVYFRLLDYYSIRKISYIKYTILLIFSFFVFDIIIAMQKISFKIEKYNELNFLKKMVIVNGSIKPINFNELLEVLMNKAKYYQKIIKEIADNSQKTEYDRVSRLTQFVSSLNTIDERLFFSKLCEADTASFDAAISIIKDEYEVSKRQIRRKVTKRIEHIHIAGIVGYMLIITLLVVYLIVPWTTAFSIGGGWNIG